MSYTSVVEEIGIKAEEALMQLYPEITAVEVAVNPTKPDFEGDYTVVLFPLLSKTHKAPQQLGTELGNYLVENFKHIFVSFNVIKGFLNLTVQDNYWTEFLDRNWNIKDYGRCVSNGKKVMVEYSSPNTNKPLHLGHLRNNFLGWSIAEILKFRGYEVVKTCIVNDRGIHICKSMIAWQRFAEGATPESTHKKGDHFVGDYYVKFNDAYKAEVKDLMEKEHLNEADAEKASPLMKATQQMLLDWESGDPAVRALWKKMNAWVFKGFDETYQRIGSDFDKVYYESNTYLLGKHIVEEGLLKGIFEKHQDGSVWIDLRADGLDEKLVQRSDGTSVYITQDIGLAELRYREYQPDRSIYVIGDEQNYHMKVLKLICQKLGLPSADGIYHLSYGMVELPSGKMKSREGTVVDADELVDEMVSIAREKTEALGKVDGFSSEELDALYHILGLGALKFFLLRVDPRRKMLFNPQESIDFHGFTGPFVQYSYARIRSILRKSGNSFSSVPILSDGLMAQEKEIIRMLEKFPAVLADSAQNMSPSALSIYIFDLARSFNTFYTECPIMHADNENKKILRLKLSSMTADILRTGLALLGIGVPERM